MEKPYLFESIWNTQLDGVKNKFWWVQSSATELDFLCKNLFLHEHANQETQNQRESTQKVFETVRDSSDKVKFLIKNGLILEIGCLALASRHRRWRGNGSLLDIEITLVNAVSKKENKIQVKKAYHISLHQRWLARAKRHLPWDSNRWWKERARKKIRCASELIFSL